MFQAALHATAHPVAHAAHAVAIPTLSSTHALSTTTIRQSSDPHHIDAHHVDAHAPDLFGVSSKAGKISSDEEQATSLEHLELLGQMQGVSVFNEEPLDSSRLGTLENPLVCANSFLSSI